jgi:heterodisulfide reductase subunit C
MNSKDQEIVFKYTGYRREDFSVCLGCKICASVCTVNDLALNVNPQELLMKLSVGLHELLPLYISLSLADQNT